MFYMATMSQCILCFIMTCVFARFFGKEYKDKTSICIPYWVKKYVFRVNKSKMEALKSYKILPVKGATIDIHETDDKQETDENNKKSEVKGEVKEDENMEMKWLDLLHHMDRLCMKIFIL